MSEKLRYWDIILPGITPYVIYRTVIFGAQAEATNPIADAKMPSVTAGRAPNDSTNEPLRNPKDEKDCTTITTIMKLSEINNR